MKSMHEWFVYNSVKANLINFKLFFTSHTLQVNDLTIKSTLSVIISVKCCYMATF